MFTVNVKQAELSILKKVDTSKWLTSFFRKYERLFSGSSAAK